MNTYTKTTSDNQTPLALVTGASRGIGRAIANVLAAEGYDLILTALVNEEMLESAKIELTTRYDINVTTFVGDIGDADNVAELFAKLRPLDLLVNNAAISSYGLLSEMTTEEWHRVMAVNLHSIFYTCKAAIPAMVKKKSGKIINITSLWGEIGAGMEVAYSTAKAGVCGFTKALAKELAPSNIQVNAIAPGLIDTDMNDCFSEDELAEIIALIPAARAGTAEEVAQLLLQIAKAPPYFTGQIVRIDGGWG
ncbi:MAG: SDR family NAD(P)-dependent oxidoreductase [Lachnospiraceae bacterium]|jgi:3-oxoacyl-[acyl-carrier protein] reductase|nr:SDR family NAD(P)-dependent oxidoreductase [Lachnospiraceae bacterium]